MTSTCIDCQKTIDKRSKRCHSCAVNTPEHRAKMSIALKGRKQTGRQSRRTHGMTGTREFTTWQMMKQRCGNSKHIKYRLYGGRGIVVCDRWLNSFENFFEDMGERPEGMTLDRIDPEGNYEPSNCRWATLQEQRANRCSS